MSLVCLDEEGNRIYAHSGYEITTSFLLRKFPLLDDIREFIDGKRWIDWDNNEAETFDFEMCGNLIADSNCLYISRMGSGGGEALGISREFSDLLLDCGVQEIELHLNSKV